MKRIIIACLAGLLFAGCSSKESRRDDRKIADQRDPGEYERDTPVAMTDPVCGMCVDTTSPVTLDHEGTTYHFCSEECLSTFQQNPAAYAQGGVTENQVD